MSYYPEPGPPRSVVCFKCRHNPCECSFAAPPGYAAKPPLGLMPHKLWKEKRLDDIIAAIGRYRDGKYIIPAEWFTEAAELSRELRHSAPAHRPEAEK